MIVNKARNMALMMKVHVLGFVENMSYITCTHCGERLLVFGEGGVDKAAAELNVPVFDKVPVDPYVTSLVDEGDIEKISTDILDNTVTFIEKLIENK
jgi:Mrp family chromosome partitioning ATPase